MFRSHLTQVLQNYFDQTDERVRQIPFTLDAQLLNALAQSLEIQDFRYGWEVAGRTLSTCPLNLDNQGCYYQVPIPNDFPLAVDSSGAPVAPSSVTGLQNGISSTLTPFDDLLPVPHTVVLDPARTSVPLASPRLAHLTQDTPGNHRLGVLPIPNTLFFWTESGSPSPLTLTVLIEGKVWPLDPWADRQTLTEETLTITAEGLARSTHLWYSVERLQIFGIPAGGFVDVYAAELALPACPDPARPFTHWAERDQTYGRYWTLAADNFLCERYYESAARGFADLPLITGKAIPFTPSGLAVEPNTYGLWISSNTGDFPSLSYLDRREPCPARLAVSAVTLEPNYGLLAELELGSFAAVQFSVQAYANAGEEIAHRYLVELPDNSVWIYAYQNSIAAWALVPYTAPFWVPGVPAQPAPFPLSEPGTHVFRLETRDGEGLVRYDATPFLYQSVTPLRTIPLPDLQQVQGLCFDAQQQLWIWDGAFLHPYQVVYYNYLFDADSRSLYLTAPFAQVQLT